MWICSHWAWKRWSVTIIILSGSLALHIIAFTVSNRLAQMLFFLLGQILLQGWFCANFACTTESPLSFSRWANIRNNPSEWSRKMTLAGMKECEFRDLPNSPDAKCAICMDDFESNTSVITLSCGHVFDSECMQHWFVSKQINTKCPICRQSVFNARDLHQIKVKMNKKPRSNVVVPISPIPEISVVILP